jgi:hypothetical protein
MRLAFFIFVLVLCGGGCIVPLPAKVTSGYYYSSEALAFLDLPDTTRDQVVASLGPPLVEVADSGVLLYAWEKASRFLFIYPAGYSHGGMETAASTQRGDPQAWGLFIGYDEKGLVTAHEVRKIGTESLTEACLNWEHTNRAK